MALICFCINRKTIINGVFFNLKSSQLVLSASFEYLRYGSTAVKDILILLVWGPSLDIRSRRLKTVSALKGLILNFIVLLT